MLVSPDRAVPVCWPALGAVRQPAVWPYAVAYAALRVAGLAVSMVLWLLMLGVAVTVPLLF